MLKMNHTPLFRGSYKRKFVFAHLISLSKKKLLLSFTRRLVHVGGFSYRLFILSCVESPRNLNHRIFTCLYFLVYFFFATDWARLSQDSKQREILRNKQGIKYFKVFDFEVCFFWLFLFVFNFENLEGIFKKK